jgi:hypothetical protein
VPASSVPPSAPAPDPSGDATARLQARLADRERRLAELTEHCLQILDELAHARTVERARDALQERIQRLEASLADARSRVRTAGGIVLAPASAPVPCEVVVWDVTDLRDRGLRQRLEAFAGVPVTLLVRPGTAVDAPDLPPACRLLVADGPNPAQHWNLAVASTAAPVVLLVRAGVDLPAAAIERLATAAAAEGVALVAPVVVVGKQRSLGLRDAGELRFEPAPASGRGKAAATDAVDLQACGGDAFALPRRAAEMLGPVDQDLRTGLAGVEWSLRARAAGLRLVGLPGVEAKAVAAAAVRDDAGDGDLLLIAARHRPEALVSVAMAMESFWSGPAAATAERLRSALLRLPPGHNGVAVDLLVHQLQVLARNAVPVPVLRGHLQQLEQVLEATLDLGAGHYTEQLQRAVAHVHEAVRGADQEVQGTLQRLADEVAAERDSKRHLEALLTERSRVLAARDGAVDALRREIAALQDAVRVHKDEIIARDGAVLALRDAVAGKDAALHAVKDEIIARDGAILGLRDALTGKDAALLAQKDEIIARDGALLALRSALADHDGAAVGHERAVADLRVRLERLDAERAAAVARLGERDREHAERLDEREREAALARGQRDAEAARAEELQRQLQVAENRLAKLDAELREFSGRHEELDAEHRSLRERCGDLDRHVHDLMADLRERERRLAAALAEVSRPRLLGRRLSAAERAFLDGQRAYGQRPDGGERR